MILAFIRRLFARFDQWDAQDESARREYYRMNRGQ